MSLKNTKFENVPVEEGTRILAQEIIILAGREVLHQVWAWDGVRAESLIYVSAEWEGIDDDSWPAITYTSQLVDRGSSSTVSHSDAGFVFVNFNFEAM